MYDSNAGCEAKSCNAPEKTVVSVSDQIARNSSLLENAVGMACHIADALGPRPEKDAAIGENPCGLLTRLVSQGKELEFLCSKLNSIIAIME